MIRQETRIAVVTVSDRCFTGEEEDKSGPFILQYLKEKGHQIFREVCVADEFKIIQVRIKAKFFLRDDLRQIVL